MSESKQLYDRTMGLLSPKGFHLEAEHNGKYVIVNRDGNRVASGELTTLYYAAQSISMDKNSDRLQDPLPDPVEARQRGLEMARKLRDGEEK